MANIHILGICGTFMAGVAILAKELGYVVTGADAQVYPPMSTQLEEQGIKLIEGYDPRYIPENTDLVVIGNALSRGNPSVEYILNKHIPYQSGPQFLAEICLQQRHVLAVAGTHGKTTTASMLAWILEYAGLKPGFLIGGVPGNFATSARSSQSKYFVIEADEYDSAFFDKQSKFLHYGPSTLILNNLEYDHADIFDSLEDIKKQIKLLIRIIPSEGLIITPKQETELVNLLEKESWTPVVYTGKAGDWQATDIAEDASAFNITYQNKSVAQVQWNLLGLHNINNALAAIAAAHHVGVDPKIAAAALQQFINVKRRMEIKGKVHDITLYDDFAHHPTAIATTLSGLRNKIGNNARIIVILEFGSYTMKAGIHKDTILDSMKDADKILLARLSNTQWSLDKEVLALNGKAKLFDTTEDIITEISQIKQAGDHIVVMSNKGFEGIHEKILKCL